MKRCLVVLWSISLLTVGSTSLNAAIEKGKKSLGYYGNLSYSRGDYSDYKSASVGGFYSYFVTDTTSLGGSTSLSYRDSDRSDSTSLDISGTVRHYLSGTASEIVPYVGASLGIDYSDLGDDSEANVSLSGSVGALKFLTEDVALDTSLSLRLSEYTTRFEANFGLTYFFE